MIVDLIKEPGTDKVIGWSMTGENEEEINKLRYIRDYSFWGFGDTVIEYNGRKNSDEATNNPGTLSWIQHKYVKH